MASTGNDRPGLWCDSTLFFLFFFIFFFLTTFYDLIISDLICDTNLSLLFFSSLLLLFFFFFSSSSLQHSAHLFRVFRSFSNGESTASETWFTLEQWFPNGNRRHHVAELFSYACPDPERASNWRDSLLSGASVSSASIVSPSRHYLTTCRPYPGFIIIGVMKCGTTSL